MSRWDKTEVTNSKKTVMSFHNYEKKVNRKTNKIRQVIDDPKKNIKCSGKKRSKKNRFKNEGKKKPTFSMKKNDSRQFLLILEEIFPNSGRRTQHILL